MVFTKIRIVYQLQFVKYRYIDVVADSFDSGIIQIKVLYINIVLQYLRKVVHFQVLQ